MAVGSVEQAPGAISSNELCAHFSVGQCYFGDNCLYIHGLPCELCGRPMVHPTDQRKAAQHREECLAEHERDCEAAFAAARTADAQCSICMERVRDPNRAGGAKRFGVLENCRHCFCLDCIRTWRSSTTQFETKVVRSCPECRTHSDFVVPSDVWIESEVDKNLLIHQYKSNAKKVECRYFKAGKGNPDACQFGNRCFYRHQNPDGTMVVGDSPRTIRRRRSAAAGGGRRGRGYGVGDLAELRNLQRLFGDDLAMMDGEPERRLFLQMLADDFDRFGMGGDDDDEDGDSWGTDGYDYDYYDDEDFDDEFDVDARDWNQLWQEEVDAYQARMGGGRGRRQNDHGNRPTEADYQDALEGFQHLFTACE